MARGKNTAAPRRRSSVGESNGNMNLLKPAVSRQEVLAGIDFHWKNISTELHDFVMSNLKTLTLIKLIGFWSKMPEAKSKCITAATCGCSWYMALQYMIAEKIPEARAMVLNGCFLQQVHNTSIEEIHMIIGQNENAYFTAYPELTFLHEGVTAISTEQSMRRFLEHKVPADYQRRMAFATQTYSGKRHVQDYINQISEDWDVGAGGSSKKLAMRHRSSLNPATDVSIEIVLVDSSSKAETKISCGSMTMKMLFKQYAEEKAIPLHRLRFSYNGGTLFLSSVGNQTPQELNMVNLDSILVTDSEASARVESEDTSSDESKENKSTARQTKKSSPKRKQQRRASWAGPQRVMDLDEHLRQLHSLRLSRVFAEAAPQFVEIRQKLNAMNLVCSLPKDKTSRKLPIAIEPVEFNSGNIGLGGKAGVSSYEIHVGESEHLYKVTKTRTTPFSVDLHGLTRDEALSLLDSKLPEWVDAAMRGVYPWVSSGVIICGGGNQILSEAVDQWIKNNVNVARAPKRRSTRRGSSLF